MNSTYRSGIAKVIWIGAVISALLIGTIGWRLSYIDHVAVGLSERTFKIPVPFDKFRQIMVRKNATQSVMDSSGMILLDEKVHGLTLDTSKDQRPILNALLGHSKSELTADKTLTVKLNDPNLNVDQLALQQHADIQNNELHIRTESEQPTGNLRSYSTTLDAVSDGLQTRVTIKIAQDVDVHIPMMFTAFANKKVQVAADDATLQQENSIKLFIAQHCDDSLILPILSQQ